MIFLGVWLFITDVLTDFDKEDCGVLTPEILNLNMLSNIHHPSQGLNKFTDMVGLFKLREKAAYL